MGLGQWLSPYGPVLTQGLYRLPDDDGPGTSSGSADGKTDPGSGGAAGDDKGEPSGEDGDKSQLSESEKKRLHDEAARHRVSAKQAMEERDKLAARLKEIEDKDKSEFEKAQGTIKTLTEENTKLKSDLEDARVLIAIYESDGAKKFRSLNAVRRLIDRAEIKFEDGEVSGVKEALEKLAKAEPYLLSEDAKGEGKSTGKSPTTPSGSPANKDGNKGGIDREALLKKFPALRR